MPAESAFSNARLCVVGNVNRDIKTAPFVSGQYLFADGETSIPAVFETIGGGGAISAAVAAALGARCDFVGQVGDDRLGLQLAEALTRTGVRCHLRRAPGLATGTTVNLVFTSGARHFLSCHPNNRSLRFEDLDLSALSASEHLYRADIWFSDAMLFGGNRQLLETARTTGLTTSLDVNWDPAWGQAQPAEIERRKAAVRDVLPWVDIVHGNIRELGEFTGASTMESAVATILDAGAGAVILHMGARGAGYFIRDQSIIEPPVPAERHLMSTGTGDVLSVCMMLLHRSALGLAERLRLANRIVAEFIEGRRALIPALS